MELDYSEGIELINELQKTNREKRLWDRYLIVLPFMHEERMEFMSYEDFKKESGFYEDDEEENKLSQEDIFDDVENNIMREFNLSKAGE